MTWITLSHSLPNWSISWGRSHRSCTTPRRSSTCAVYSWVLNSNIPTRRFTLRFFEGSSSCWRRRRSPGRYTSFRCMDRRKKPEWLTKESSRRQFKDCWVEFAQSASKTKPFWRDSSSNSQNRLKGTTCQGAWLNSHFEFSSCYNINIYYFEMTDYINVHMEFI